MLITPLQKLLRDRVVPEAEIIKKTGRKRWTVWRWREGKTRPTRQDARLLIELYREAGADLNFDGCYLATVEVVDE